MPKQFRSLSGKPVLRRAVEALIGHPRIERVQVVIGTGQEELARQALAGLDVGDFISGGETRNQSVVNGLDRVQSKQVLVHDAARPFCPPVLVDRLLGALESHDGAVPVLPVQDTIARADELLREPIDRSGAVRVQTPQAFRTEHLRTAHSRWNGGPATDDASVARAAGMEVAVVDGDPMLDKLTTEADWARAEQMLAARMVARTGFGFDVHSFAGEGPIMMGGIAVPHPRGLSGHSDADVALHAITDALLGAAALGDIGEHFPPSEARWKGASSDIFLAHAAELVRSRGGIIDHVDCTIICEEPRVGPHRSAMRGRIAAILGIAEQQVSVKATTTEGLGFTGRREGIASQAVASIRLETAP
jgi:2-C-methyl-D-erythritol 4-phosphate cytidylyltransferase/2-C-methyl-D-erythritol 2,4-cyclodiphosphate synthase